MNQIWIWNLIWIKFASFNIQKESIPYHQSLSKMYRTGIVKSCSISTWQIKSSFFLFVINSGFLCIAVLYISGEKPLKIYAFVQNIHITRTLLNWLFKRHYPIMYSLLGYKHFAANTAQKMKFVIKDFLSKDQQETTNLVIFTEEILNRKLHFMCSESMK